MHNPFPPLPAAVVHALDHALTTPFARVIFLEADARSARDRFDDLEQRLRQAIPNAFELLSVPAHSTPRELRLGNGSRLQFRPVADIHAALNGANPSWVLISAHAWATMSTELKREYARHTAFLDEVARPIIPEL